MWRGSQSAFCLSFVTKRACLPALRDVDFATSDLPSVAAARDAYEALRAERRDVEMREAALADAEASLSERRRALDEASEGIEARLAEAKSARAEAEASRDAAAKAASEARRTLDAAETSRAEAEASSRRNDSSEPSSSSSPPPPPSPSRAFGSLRFFRHVRMRKAKVARLDVAAGLPAALAVLEEARRGGAAATLVACEDGTDHCVGVAVARLCERFATDVVATKADVRKALAEVAARHPEAAPTRGTLKQVFHHLTRGREGEEG